MPIVARLPRWNYGGRFFRWSIGAGGIVIPLDAWEDLLATAVCAEINDPARTWAALLASESCVAIRSRAPWYKKDPLTKKFPLATLKIAVVPLTIGRERVSRDRRKMDYGIGVDLQRIIDPDDDTTLKLFSKLAQDVHDWFDNGHPLATQPAWICLKSDRPDVYALTDLFTDGIWETFICMDIRGYR